ncbi:MAG: GNAT family N-acetyltransferase [Candidatus Krumholzibacteriia bacterium]
MEWTKGNFRVNDDQAELDLYYIVPALQESYWAIGRTMETVKESIEHSLCFGLYSGLRQIGFARVVTDRCTFAWICDVMVHPDFRGTGLGKWLMECVEEHPWVQGASQKLLRTRDAHGLYERYGYVVCDAMVKKADSR